MEQGRLVQYKARVFDLNAVIRCLDDGVLFGMNAPAEFMPLAGFDIHFLTETADFPAMANTAGGTVITGCQDPFVLDDQRAHGPPQAGGAFGHQNGDVHEIFFPGRTLFIGHKFCSSACKNLREFFYPGQNNRLIRFPGKVENSAHKV